MARRLLKSVPTGSCRVKIYKDSYAGEFVVQTIVKGKVQGGKGGGYFTEDRQDAEATATAITKQLTTDRRCHAVEARTVTVVDAWGQPRVVGGYGDVGRARSKPRAR